MTANTTRSDAMISYSGVSGSDVVVRVTTMMITMMVMMVMTLVSSSYDDVGKSDGGDPNK